MVNPLARTSDRARPRRSRCAVSAAASLSCLLLSACGGSGGHVVASSDTAPTAASASPSPRPDAVAKANVLAAYQGFWNIQVQAYSAGSLEGLPVNKYAVGSAFYDIEKTLQYYQQNHEVMRGKPVLTPQVSGLQVTKAPFSATITDCIDTSGFLPFDARTGKQVQLSSSVHRHPWTFTATFDNVQWYINSGKLDRSRTC